MRAVTRWNGRVVVCARVARARDGCGERETDETRETRETRRTFDEHTELAVKTLQIRYGLPASGQWGALERMMFEEVGIHTDAPRLEALAPPKLGAASVRVGASSSGDVVLAKVGKVPGAMGSAMTGAAIGLGAAFVMAAADNALRGGSARDFVGDTAANLRGVADMLKPQGYRATAQLEREAVAHGDDGREGDDRWGYDGRGDGGRGRDPRGPPPDGLPPGASESYYGLDAQYHTSRTRSLMAGAMPVATESERAKPKQPMRRPGGGPTRAAAAALDLQRRQQVLVNTEAEVEAEVAVGASSRPMATMIQRVRQSLDAGWDAIGDVIPDRIPLLGGNGSDFTARAHRERELNARLAEARYYAELEQQKRMKAEQAFKQSHQKWLDAQAATRQVRAQAAETAAKLVELEERLFREDIFDNHPVVSKVTELENLLMRETEEEKTTEQLKSELARLEMNSMNRVKELEEQVSELQLELQTRPELPKDVIARLEALEIAVQSGTSYDTERNSVREIGLQQNISDVGVALAELRAGLRSEMQKVQVELQSIHPLMDHGAGRIDILFAKVTAIESSIDAVSEGAAAQIGRLAAQVERLERALSSSSGIVLKPFPQVNEVDEEEDYVDEEEQEEEKPAIVDVVVAPIEEDVEEETLSEVGSSVDSAATDFMDVFRESQQVVNAMPIMPAIEPKAEPMPVEQNVVRESGVMPRIAVGREIMLQGFHWESHNHDWYRIVQDRLGEMNRAGFTQVWLPPPADSLAPQGYMPRNLYSLNSAYGSEQSLRNLITSCKEHDVLPVLDAVLNHRCATHQGSGGKWNRWEGTGMDWGEWAIDNRNPNFGGTGNHPTGDEFGGAPNIDHTNQRVRDDLSSWLKWLRNDVGFGGVRFDFSKGYHGRYAGEYIKAMDPEFAVGEYWDTLAYSGGLEYNQDAHRQRIIDWIDNAGGNTTAFDFTTKGILQEACGRSEFWRLIDSKGRAPGVIGLWPARAVTFIDNHDTGSTQGHWPFPNDKVAMGYAYILTHPGTPCVLWDHFFDWGEHLRKNIEKLMEARQSAGVHSRSKLQIVAATDGLYAAIIDGKMAVKLGRDHWSPTGDGWKHVAGEHDWTVWRQ